jgi:hypothetical protein
MIPTSHDEAVELVVLLFILFVGVAAVRWGKDSRIDERKRRI